MLILRIAIEAVFLGIMELTLVKGLGAHCRHWHVLCGFDVMYFCRRRDWQLVAAEFPDTV